MRVLKLLAVPAFFLVMTGMASSAPLKKPVFRPLEFTPPRAEKRVLSNGATVFFLPDAELPIINLTAYIRTGTMFDDFKRPGTASLTGAMIRAGGTASRKPERIDEELEFLGASVETWTDMEMGGASLSVLSKDLDKGLEILADVLMHSAFRKDKLEIAKARIIEDIRRRNDEPFQIARREVRKLVYGPSHPISRVIEIPEVRAVTARDLKRFYEEYYCPNNMMIAVSGDFKTDEMAKKLEAAFKGWKPKEVRLPPVSRIPDEARTVRAIGYAEKALTQASVLMAQFGVARHNPDHFSLEVMNEILGGSSFTSRLYRDVRERQGLAYWVGSSFSEPWDRGTIAAGCQTKSGSAGRAIRSILGEFERMKKEPVSPDELAFAKDSIINSFVFRYASPHAIAAETLSLEYFGYPPDYLEAYTRKTAGVTAGDVLGVSQKYLQPELMDIVVVGNGKDFDEPLSSFGTVKHLDLSIPE